MRRPLEELLRDPGFTPSTRDVPALVALLAGEDAVARLAARALVRVGAAAVAPLTHAFDGADPPARGRILDALSDLAVAGHDTDGLVARFVAALDDGDAKTRRNAVIALGHHERPEVERALIGYWNAEDRSDHRRSVARALARVGGDAALALLRLAPVDDPALLAACREATLSIERRRHRDAVSAIDDEAVPAHPLPLVARCRRGLEALCAESYDPRDEPRPAGGGRVALTLRGALSTAWRSRIAYDLAFPLTPVSLDACDDVDALVLLLTSQEARTVFDTFTRGIVRYRIEWVGAGHRRGATARTVERVSRIAPTFVNDSRDATWQVDAFVHEGRLYVDLVPRRLDDPRFTYRVAEVPAASHPTIAAAIARLAGARPDDVVWDPFVGSALELCERARLGPWRRLVGRDRDRGALEAARKNLDAAAVVGAELEHGDALDAAPMGVTLVITNPPLGARAAFGEDVRGLHERLVAHAARALEPGGRMVWLSPRPERTARAALDAGLLVKRRVPLALAGYDAELQRYDKPERVSRPRPRRRG